MWKWRFKPAHSSVNFRSLPRPAFSRIRLGGPTGAIDVSSNHSPSSTVHGAGGSVFSETQHESAQRLSLALDAADLGDWDWNAETDAIRLSARATKIFGLPADVIITRTQMRDLLHEEDRPLAKAALDRAAAERKEYDIEYRVIRANDQQQVWVAAKYLGNITHQNRRITNVVMMGMGEPLANFDAVVRAMSLMRDDLGFGLAAKRVTLSTAGMVPQIDQLSEVIDVSLAVSLHAANDELRTELVPLNKRYPIADLIAACQRWVARKPRTSITFEYTLMKGVNDQPLHARQLVKLMRKLPTCKVNLIPFNPFPGTRFERSEASDIHDFQTLLLNAGVLTMLRRTRGDDIDAACGQLAGQVMDRTRRSADIRKRNDEGAAHAL